jgi:hypothetical protein
MIQLNVTNTVKPVYNKHPRDSKKWLLFKGSCYLEVASQKLLLILESWGSGWSLSTSDHCSELVVETSLTL